MRFSLRHLQIFTAVVRLASDTSEVCLWYTDWPDVVGAYRAYRDQAPKADSRLHEGMYCQSMGQYGFYA